ncbi:outer membrane receptor protein involved in Fe transport [Aquimarina sp. EL_43]|uniref:outer membrane beta-barrel family protein n=1 Tax=unclassified Aquimarina TaxID=2627091 RepID=UPI0018CAEFB8|nr:MULTISPECIES: outer membrane beta-barrel family protein [unclassified Aquimarina]MBG6128962.1 outer membrane receptor protein involved in Fe transport [Aquimarina sp. EL_35]MBG6150026.1 outer membrane receptor protein involved in Fe transport [Aquimarina sp. EL_32]MBG6167287.1 outer membrane receptor protein involved in Fe transport [Aquimarina sp. EL_43]
MIRTVNFILFFFIGFSIMSGQEIKMLKGTVKDQSTQEIIPYATVAVYNNKGELVDGISTNDEGQFLLETDKIFTYFEISFIGYQTALVQFSEVGDPTNISIRLQSMASTLDEIVIEADRTTTQLKIDRKIIDIGADIQQSGTTALEAFDQITDIQTDLGTGNISLRGSDNVKLLINGKPSSLDAIELLEQIPSSSIKTVEIITSPSAKYQADGLSGVINVILKRNINRGFNLNLNSALGTKRYSYGIDGNYNLSFMNLRFNASQSGREMDSKQTINRSFINGDTQGIFTPHDFNGKIKRGIIGLDFFVDEHNEFSLGFDYTDDYHSFYNNSQYFNVTNRDDFLYTRNSAHSHFTSVFNANYRRGFNKEGHFLEIDYNLNDNKNDYPSTDFEDNIFLFDQIIEEDNTIHAISLDYALPVSEKITIETGASWNKSDTKNQQLFRSNNTVSTLDTFDYEEELLGIYGLTKFRIQKLDWQVGLRYEYFSSKSQNTLNLSTTNLHFSNLFPSIHVTYTFSEDNTLGLGYSKRISRPNLHHINPFQLGNPFFRFDGNPGLKPESSDNIELNYQNNKRKLNWSVATFYRYRKDVILWVNTIEDNNVQVISFQNIGINHSLGIETTLKYRFAKYWNTVLTGNYYYTMTDQNNLVTWDELYSSNLQLKNTFKITKKVSTDITYRHTPKRQNAFNYIEPRHRVDWAVRAKFLNNKLTANLRVIDVLDNNLMKRNTRTPEFSQRTVWKFQSQTLGFLFSLKYTLFKSEDRARNRKEREYRHNHSSN